MSHARLRQLVDLARLKRVDSRFESEGAHNAIVTELVDELRSKRSAFERPSSSLGDRTKGRVVKR